MRTNHDLLIPSLLAATALSVTFVTGCASDGGDGAATDDDSDDAFPRISCADVEGECVEVLSSDPEALHVATNTLVDGMTVILGTGTFVLENQVTIRSADGVTLTGQGMDETSLDFSTQAAQSNGVDGVGDDIEISFLQIVDAKKDGLRIEDSTGVTIRSVRATWSAGPESTNGAYGLYPVKSHDVLIEDSEASNAADAGIYVGQCVGAVVRNNRAVDNVAGLEIENTQYADVYGNTVEDNTGGLVVFDLPGNPVIGRDVKIHDNIVRNNNRVNFAPGGTVRSIPPGTGTFAMASRRVEIVNNTYENNKSFDVAVVSGLIIEGDEEKWALAADSLVGDWEDLGLDADGDTVYNYRTEQVWVHGNSHTGSGTAPTGTPAQELGALLALVYYGEEVDDIIYDTIGESMFDPVDPAGNSNDNHICVTDPGDASFGNLDIEGLANAVNPDSDMVYQPDEPFVPFDCTGFDGGPLVTVDLD
jgi:parallel beta-helix repeat protein